jgi:hypothetical protein
MGFYGRIPTEHYRLQQDCSSLRVLKATNPLLSDECLETALELWNAENGKVKWINNKVFAFQSLYLRPVIRSD